jgi:hypothetical protein
MLENLLSGEYLILSGSFKYGKEHCFGRLAPVRMRDLHVVGIVAAALMRKAVPKQLPSPRDNRRRGSSPIMGFIQWEDS